MKRILLWVVGVVVLVVVVIGIAFVVSPWPSVLIISQSFAGNDTASEAALVKFAPPGIVSKRDLSYGANGDERFDISSLPNTPTALPVVVWVHGGGWIGGSKGGVANYLKNLAGHGYVTVGLDYSTAPGATYPTPVRQVNDALDYLVAHAGELGIDPQSVVLAGDSAGAQIASQLANITTDPDYAHQVGIEPSLKADQLRGIVLVSGAYDITAVIPSVRLGSIARPAFLSLLGLTRFAWQSDGYPETSQEFG